MKVNANDPKWTAYVLGELSDAERAEVEHELESSPEARDVVDDIRMMTTLLKDELANEPAVSLLAEHRSAIVSSISPKPGFWNRRWVFGGLATAVAALVLLTVELPTLVRSRQAATTIATQPRVPAVSIAPKADSSNEINASTQATQPGAKQEPPVAGIYSRLQQTPAATGVSGAVTGVVADPIGSSIPGVQVTLSSPKGQVETVTDETGKYQFADLPPGEYQLKYALPGFTTKTQNAVVEAGQAVARDARMEVGAVAETVTVTSQNSKLLEKETNAALSQPELRVSDAFAVAGQRGGAAPKDLYSRAFSVARGGAAAPPPAASPAALPPGVRPDRPVDRPFNTEAYDRIEDNPFKSVADNPLATFSIDVDTAAYANTRRFLDQNQLPPKDAVRIEELINYFNYEYAQPSGSHPIAVHAEAASAPWKADHRLVRIAVKAKDIDISRRPPGNLVFLIDVSGSMEDPNKLPLLKSALKLLVDKLGENDRVSIAVYAGNSGLVLQPTRGDRKEIIVQALDRLEAGGSTNGASGIQLAYNVAVSNFIKGGINRVILCTDGDFNVGVTNQGDLTRLIEDRAKSGVFLSVLGFGMGNLKDSTMEKLADKGNGNYAYIDSLNEARKVLVEEMGGTLMTIAKDVKIQVDFNPDQVNAYRLIGYENRVLRDQDFNDDTKDAGDMGAGQTVTALFEIVPRGVEIGVPTVDPSKYRRPAASPAAADRRGGSNELLTVRVRYKQPDASESTRFDVPLTDRGSSFESASADYRFAAAVAEFGMILRESPFKGSASMDHVIATAERSRGADKNGYREEFVRLARKARAIKELR